MENVKNVEIKEEDGREHRRKMFDGESSIRDSSDREEPHYGQEEKKKDKGQTEFEVKNEEMEEEGQ